VSWPDALGGWERAKRAGGGSKDQDHLQWERKRSRISTSGSGEGGGEKGGRGDGTAIWSPTTQRGPQSVQHAWVGRCGPLSAADRLSIHCCRVRATSRNMSESGREVAETTQRSLGDRLARWMSDLKLRLQRACAGEIQVPGSIAWASNLMHGPASRAALQLLLGCRGFGFAFCFLLFRFGGSACFLPTPPTVAADDYALLRSRLPRRNQTEGFKIERTCPTMDYCPPLSFRPAASPVSRRLSTSRKPIREIALCFKARANCGAHNGDSAVRSRHLRFIIDGPSRESYIGPSGDCPPVVPSG
jgi:hypothetical protein